MLDTSDLSPQWLVAVNLVHLSASLATGLSQCIATHNSTPDVLCCAGSQSVHVHIVPTTAIHKSATLAGAQRAANVSTTAEGHTVLWYQLEGG